MLILSKNFTNIPIYSIRSGSRVGKVILPLINPSNLKIEGWYCSILNHSTSLILLSNHIRQLSANSLIINDLDDLSEPDDLHRLQGLIELDYELLGKPVYCNKKQIGKVNDYTIDSGSMFIHRIHVTPGIFDRLLTDKHIIDRSQIIEVNDYYIKVKDTTVKSRVNLKKTINNTKKSLNPAYTNNSDNTP